jgi:hypothetical protein
MPMKRYVFLSKFRHFGIFHESNHGRLALTEILNYLLFPFRHLTAISPVAYFQDARHTQVPAYTHFQVYNDTLVLCPRCQGSNKCPFSLPLSRHPSDSNFLDHDLEKIIVIHHRSERRHTSISPLESFATPVRLRLSGARWTALIHNGNFLLFHF